MGSLAADLARAGVDATLVERAEDLERQLVVAHEVRRTVARYLASWDQPVNLVEMLGGYES